MFAGFAAGGGGQGLDWAESGVEKGVTLDAGERPSFVAETEFLLFTYQFKLLKIRVPGHWVKTGIIEEFVPEIVIR